MSIGWMASLAEADDYYDNRFQNALWLELTEQRKTAALTTAYKRIYYSSDFDVPDPPSAALLAKLKDAQCEMTYYLLVHLKDEDVRKGLQAQGITTAGILKETYDKDSLNKVPIPPIVEEILVDIYKYSSSFAVVDIDRDEDESVDKDVVDL